MSRSSKAFRTSGRFSVSRETGDSSSSLRPVYVFMEASILHPEDRSAAADDGRVERRREGESHHLARLGRIDDAVVPEVSGGVVGAALLLVLGQHRIGD